MPGGFEPDDALWVALAECDDAEEMSAVLGAWIAANQDYWSSALPSPAGWTAPGGLRPGRNWSPPCGLLPRPERMPLWVRAWYHTPLLDRSAREWMWHHGGFDVLPPGEQDQAKSSAE